MKLFVAFFFSDFTIYIVKEFFEVVTEWMPINFTAKRQSQKFDSIVVTEVFNLENPVSFLELSMVSKIFSVREIRTLVLVRTGK